MSWTGYFTVMVAFFVTHSVPVRPPVRAAIVRRIGETGFTIAYSALSLAMLVAVIAAAGRAPYVQLWPQAAWHHPVVMAGMLVVCIILAFAIGRPNPFSFGGARNARFDPAFPGIVRWTRHPVLTALLLWSLLHLLPNGDLAHVILFGMFGAFACVGTRLIDRRKQREMGRAHWDNTLNSIDRSKVLPRPEHWPGVGLRAILAMAAYGALFWLHPLVIGVSIQVWPD